MNLVPVAYKIIYNNKDITRDISDHILSISYVDKVQGEADEIEITVEDKDGLWQNDWYPEKKDTLEVFIDDNGLQLPCGKFSIDELKLSSSRGDGDVVSISGLAASITKKMRTKKNTAHENKTLKQLAQFVADGQPQIDLTAFSPDRFTPSEVAEYQATTVPQSAAVRRRH